MFKNAAAEFVYVRTYSRWIEELQRRETWPETVERYVSFILKHQGEKIPKKVVKKIRERLLAFEVMPSMRALWAAGPAAEADNVTMYNCAFQCINSIEAFAENLYILMCGAGYGFRVARDLDVGQLPVVPADILPTDRVHVVEDSKAGWANSVKELCISLYSGFDLKMDYSNVRKEGARLKTMGGRASGPAPLISLHQFIRDTLFKARGRKIGSLEAHDICCETAQIVVVGGVRRSSEISISELEDSDLRHAKTGEYPNRRWMANNSAMYLSKPSMVHFMREWEALAASRSGERGIFNLDAARRRAPARRDASRIDGTNPCAEILLRDRQFCNLSEVVTRPEDTIDDMLEKVETATWLGVIQSTFTYFPYLNKAWAENCEEERLLGVSITGQLDAPNLFTPEALKAYKARAVKVAKKASEIMGVNMPAAITCVKPSGTVSQLTDAASGLHPRFADFYIRRYRINATDPLCKMLKAQGFKLSPENGQGREDWEKAREIHQAGGDLIKAKSVCAAYDGGEWSESKVSTWVIGFPMKAPENSIVVADMTALQQLEWYKKIQTNWCEHNASITVYVKDEEWLAVGDWVYKNWDVVSGVSFLPHEDNDYKQAPYEKITEKEYEKAVKAMPAIDYSELSRFEKEDSSTGAKAFACVGGGCDT